MSREAEKNQEEYNKTTLPTDNETIQTNKNKDFYNTQKSSKSNNYKPSKTDVDTDSMNEASESQ